MPDFIRVRFKDSGTVQTIAKPSAIDPEVMEVLDDDATDRNQRPVAPEFPAKSKSGQKAATTEKEKD